MQAAPIYYALHRQAVALLPPGQGQLWLDLGSGAGLVAQLAWQRGYRAHGGAEPTFEQATLAELVQQGRRAQVVSAASLLQVLPDARKALSQMLQLVAPDGLVIVMGTGERLASTAPLRLPWGNLHCAAVTALWWRSRRVRVPLNRKQLRENLPMSVSRLSPVTWAMR